MYSRAHPRCAFFLKHFSHENFLEHFYLDTSHCFPQAEFVAADNCKIVSFGAEDMKVSIRQLSPYTIVLSRVNIVILLFLLFWAQVVLVAHWGDVDVWIGKTRHQTFACLKARSVCNIFFACCLIECSLPIFAGGGWFWSSIRPYSRTHSPLSVCASRGGGGGYWHPNEQKGPFSQVWVWVWVGVGVCGCVWVGGWVGATGWVGGWVGVFSYSSARCAGILLPGEHCQPRWIVFHCNILGMLAEKLFDTIIPRVANDFHPTCWGNLF